MADMVASVPELTKRSFSMAGIAGGDALGQVGLGGGGGAKAGGVAGGAFDGFDDRRKGVAENHGAPGAEVVDESTAVGVGKPGSLGRLNKRGRAAHRAESTHGRVDATGEESLCALLEDKGPGAGTGLESSGDWGAHVGFSIECAGLRMR